MLDSLTQDLRYSLRSLLARPGFLIAAVLTLALGIGANIAIFSVVNALLIKPLPFPDAERLVLVHNNYPGMGLAETGTSVPDYLERREQVTAFQDIGLYTGISLNLASDGAPQRLSGVRASASLFSTLQVAPLLGRTFSADEDQPGRDRVLVLSHGLWQSRFAGAADVIGRPVRVNGHDYRVIGVMPPGFVFPNPQAQAWVPFAFSAEEAGDEARGNEYSNSIARLAPGATPDQAHAQMAAIVQRNGERIAMAGERATQMARLYREGGFSGSTKPLREDWVGEVRPVLWLLQAVAGLVLLIACANVANLMLARLASRRKELAVRNALGAGRRRIARQLLIEALLLALVGALAGIVVAWLGLKALTALGLTDSPLQPRIGIDMPVLLFALGLTALTGIVFGLFPALTPAGGGVVGTLKESGRGHAGGRRAQATRNLLAMVQIGLCATLLVGAGLLLRSYERVQNVDPGFDRDGRVTMRVSLAQASYASDDAIEQFIDAALANLRAIPGVSEAAWANHLPFGNTSSSAAYQIQGTGQGVDQPLPHGHWRVASDDMFSAMGVPLLAGRLFNEADRRDTAPVVIIDELLARRQFGDVDPIGRRLRAFGSQDESQWATIVGVVGSVHQANLAQAVDKETYWFAHRQFPFARMDTRNGYFLVNSDLPASALAGPLRQAVQRVDPEQPVFDIRSLDQRIAESLQGRQAPMLLLALFAGVALLLSTIGIYAVLAWSVAQRTGELGVRMAIGASRGEVVRMVLAQGGRIAGLGLAIGLLVALALGGVLGNQLYGVSRFDPITFLAVAVVLGGIALIACWLPARRAAKVDPITALRHA
ncbi:MAG: ABC transporter permease [Xanthomonadales bacterium]|nr:ABC transporter permease [Xanthomonadales bacterium]